MDELKNRIIVIVGAVLLALVGRNVFYMMAQDKRGIIGKFANAFCSGHAGRVGENFSYYKEGIDKERITDSSRKFYSDDSLSGYGDVDYGKHGDGKPLLEQQRGLIIPLVIDAIEKDKPSRILEIGTGNGDVLVYLASKFPDIEFTGIDLSVANARERYGNGANYKFVKGYALDELQSKKVGGELVFGTSIFMALAPKELVATLNAMHDARRIIISDPVTFGNKHSNELAPKSRHMDLYMWWHNYYGYLISMGFTVEVCKEVGYVYSHNPNCKVVLISAII